MEDAFRGRVEDVIFENSENGYTVFTLIEEKEGEEITCVGIVPQILAGETLEVRGNWTTHPVYGRQLQVTYFEKSMPNTAEGMEKYLASGVIKGLGPKTAAKIIEKFGEASFYVIEEKPEKLVEIRGITYEKARRIHEAFCEQYEMRRAMLFLQSFDLTPSTAMRIYKKYKDRTFSVVKENPYRLAEEVWGIGFKTADKMAAKAGMAADAPQRVCAAVQYVLNQAVANGDCYLPKEEVIRAVTELISLQPIQVENALRQLQVDSRIWQEKVEQEDRVYLNFYYYAEMAVAKRLLELSMAKEERSPEEMEALVAKEEKESGRTLAPEQKIAVLEALQRGLLLITGGPGTGKTTTINTILSILEKEGLEVVLAAPTGRAAKRMTEATGMEAKTLHRLLGAVFMDEEMRRQSYEHHEENPIEADVIIVDEVSMVDLVLMNAFLKAVADGTRLIFVGDADQLPSVGAGNVLQDMIRSQRLPVVRLCHIFRQAQESEIIMNAHRINEGVEPVYNAQGTDFFLVRRVLAEEAAQTVVDLVTKRLPAFSGCDSMQGIQVLTPMRKGTLGVQNLNRILQQALNPPQKHKAEHEFRGFLFREGDKVMQIKNNYNLAWKQKHGITAEEGCGVYNGDMGIIRVIDEDEEVMRVLFDDGKEAEYDFSRLDELELAYAITIHKSQGSEYPVVVIPTHSGPPLLMNRNLLYTGVTRAKQLVVLVGLKETVREMIANDKEIERRTGLAMRIRNMYDFLFGEVEV